MAQQPDPKLATWSPHIATLAEQVVTETMDVADANTVTLLRSRTPVQEVLNTIDERQAG